MIFLVTMQPLCFQCSASGPYLTELSFLSVSFPCWSCFPSLILAYDDFYFGGGIFSPYILFSGSSVFMVGVTLCFFLVCFVVANSVFLFNLLNALLCLSPPLLSSQLKYCRLVFVISCLELCYN